MPIKRGHVAPQNTYIVTLIRSFDSQCINFLAANAMFHTKPIIYCSEGLCELLGYTKGQLMLKSSTLKILHGPETSAESIESLCLALEETKETEIAIRLYSNEGFPIPCRINVTPVRDETGQLPLYLLFFHRDTGCSVAQDTLTKRSSFRSRLQLKQFRANRNSSDGHKRQHNLNAYKSSKSSLSRKKKEDSRKSSEASVPEHCEDTSVPPTGSRRHFASHSRHNSIASIADEAGDSQLKTQPDPFRRNRPVSLFLPDHSEGQNEVNQFLRPPPNPTLREIGDKVNTTNTSGEIVSGRSRAATWYKTRTASEENNSPVLLRPFNARGRSGAHINTAESEALRLVLSSHTEPTKSSVTEKFAQFLSMDEDLHVEHRFQSPRMHKFTLKHYSVFKAVWDWIILALIIYTAIATPYTAVFLIENGNKYAKLIAYRNNSQWDSYAGTNASGLNATSPRSPSSSSALLSTVDILVDIMFFVDILINFRTTYVNKNDEVVSHPRRIATHYIKGWFFIDLVAAIPFDLIFFQSSGEQPTALTSVLKSARLLRLVGIVRKLDRYSEYGASILLLLTALFALIAHWLACIWYAIGHAEHLRREPKIGWLDTLAVQTEQHYTDDPHSGPNLPTKYITALYFTFSSLTSIGFGNVSPNTNAEKVFSIIVMLVGSLMYASIFGNVGALIQRLYSGTARYHAQMLRIKEFIRFHQIPSPLKQRLEEYSTQVWEHTNGIDMTMVQYSFPESLQSDICLYVYRDFLGGSFAFKSLNDGCLRNISLRIRAAHMPPSDTLIHTGDLLTAVYYVVKGSLEVVTTDDLILGVLNPGDFFGGLPTLAARTSADRMHYYPCECALLPPSAGSTAGTACWRGSTVFPPCSAMSVGLTAQHNPPPKSRFAVRALTYADVQFIDRHDLADLCTVYPELPDRILERFELTIPLASSVSRVHSAAKVAPSWFSARSTLDSFLATCATWNAVPAATLSTTVSLTMRRPSRVDGLGYTFGKPSEIFSPSRPIWELERLQRLFDHGTLCSSSVDSTALHPYNNPVPNPTSGHGSHLYGGVHHRSNAAGNAGPTNRTDRDETMTTPTNTTNTTTMSPSYAPSTGPSPQDRRLRMLQGRPRSPHDPRSCVTSQSQPCAPASGPDRVTGSDANQPLSDANARAVQLLVTRFARVEHQLEQLDVRISQTVSSILQQLQTNLNVPLNNSATHNTSTAT